MEPFVTTIGQGAPAEELVLGRWTWGGVRISVGLTAYLRVGGEWCRLWTERFTDGDPSTSHTCVWRLGRFRDLQGHKLDLTVWLTIWRGKIGIRTVDVDFNGGRVARLGGRLLGRSDYD